MKCRFDTVGGLKTRWLHEGDGPAVLLIHGVGGSGDMWCKNIDALAEKIHGDRAGHRRPRLHRSARLRGRAAADGGGPAPQRR